MKINLTFPGTPVRLAEVRQRVREFLAECRVEESDAALLVLALDEACTNIIRHAYGNACKPVRMEMERLRDRVRFVLRDYGKSCPPEKIQSRPLTQIRPGGVGVHIIRQAFDEVTYTPQPRGTRLVLVKYLPAAETNGQAA